MHVRTVASSLFAWLLLGSLAWAAPERIEDFLPPPRTDEEIQALKDLGAVVQRQHTNEEFVAAIRRAKSVFLSIKPGTQGQPTWRTFQLNALEIKFDVIKFRTPPANQPYDLYWLLAIPPNVNLNWYIVPEAGDMNGFRDFKSFANFKLEDKQLPNNNLTIVQGLTGGALEPDKEYYLWFRFPTNEKMSAQIALTLVPAGTVAPANAHTSGPIGDALGLKPLWVQGAIQLGMVKRLEELIKAEPKKLTVRLQGGFQVLHMASVMNQLEMVEKLLELGADANSTTADGRTALFHAALENHLEVAQFLLTKTTKLDQADQAGLTVAHVAAELGQDSLLLKLAERKANLDAADKGAWTPLHRAAEHGQTTTVELLLAQQANLQAVTNEGWTPLHLAARRGHGHASRVLLKAGANVNLGDKRQVTPLMMACFSGDLQMLETLLEGGADFKAPAMDGEQATHILARRGNVKGLKLLKTRGADLNAKMKNGRTPLIMAAFEHPEAVAWLLDQEVDVKVTDEKGFNALHVAAVTGQVANMKRMQAAGVDVNALSSEQESALHYAAAEGRTDTVRWLLEQGANPKQKNKDNDTPLDLAKQRKQVEVIAILEPATNAEDL